MTEFSSICTDYLEIEKCISPQVIQVRTFFLEQHSVVIPETSNNFIERCLRLKDGNVKNAIFLVASTLIQIDLSIEKFYFFTAEVSKWNGITLQPTLYFHNFYNHNMIFPLSNRDSLGRRVIIITGRQWDPSKISFNEAVIACWMLSQYCLAESVLDQRHGFVVVWDFTGITFHQLLCVKQMTLLKLARWYQNGIVGRGKEMHLVNQPKIASLIYAGMKPFLSNKIKRRIHFHNSVESLHTHVDVKYLPTCLGGKFTLEECVDRKFMEVFANSDKYFRDMIRNRFPSY